MKERPILFSAPMVQAIRAGRKTATRRVMKPQPEHWSCQAPGMQDIGGLTWKGRCYEADSSEDIQTACPYGRPGDRLWLKETHRFPVCFDDKSASEIAASALDANYRKPWAPIRYEADNAARDIDSLIDFGRSWGKTRVSIHMPRWASRILLEITDVRVERLNDISEADKAAEGATPDMPFGTVWRRINTTPGIRWEDDPWVWAISFRVLEGLA